MIEVQRVIVQKIIRFVILSIDNRAPKILMRKVYAL